MALPPRSYLNFWWTIKGVGFLSYWLALDLCDLLFFSHMNINAFRVWSVFGNPLQLWFGFAPIVKDKWKCVFLYCWLMVSFDNFKPFLWYYAKGYLRLCWLNATRTDLIENKYTLVYIFLYILFIKHLGFSLTINCYYFTLWL